MITDSMKLQSRDDAHFWADNFGVETDAGIDRLASWIWDNKPFIGCTRDDHPVFSLTDTEFWGIVDPT